MTPRRPGRPDLRGVAATALAVALLGCAGSRAPSCAAGPWAARARPDTSAAVARAMRWQPALDAPRVDSAGRVAWTRAPRPVGAAIGRVRERLAAGDTAAAWRAALEPAGLAPFAWRHAARAALAAGDTARADSAWSRLASLPSPWAWEGLRERADLAAASGDGGRADALLATADRDAWGDADRAAWLARRAMLGAALGDTAQSLDRCRQLVRRHPGAPSAPATAALLETLLVARGERPALDDVVALAEVAALAGDRLAAARRLEGARPTAPAPRRFAIGLRAGELLRQDKSFAAARRTLRAAAEDARDAGDRARVLLEQARTERDAGAAAAGLEAFRQSVAASVTPATRAVAAWEYALELDAGGRGAAARAAYRTVARAGGARASEASLRVALSWLVDGRVDSARSALAGATDDGARFWRATLRPRAERALADADLRAVAGRPGYGFYAVAARETLALRGWNGTLARDDCAHSEACAPLDRAGELAAVGATDDAMAMLGPWAAAARADARLKAAGVPDLSANAPADPVDAGPAPRAAPSAGGPDAPGGAAGLPLALLRASRVAFNAGRVPAGIRLAQRALDGSDSSLAWAVTPWLFPPAFDSLYAAASDRIAAAGLAPELVRAVAWQESRFDPQARSRSNALGLYQFKLPTAGDVARWLGEPPPTEARLFDPARSIRYGIAYLEWLMRRFDHHAMVAVAAYNSGPSAVSPDWRRELDRGGAALFCERIGRAETRDYVRRVMGARAAYRELAPYLE